MQYASDYSRVALLLSFGADLRDQNWFLEKGKEGEMQLTWRDTVCAGQGRFPVPTGCTRAWLPAGLLVFFIISAQPLWAQTASRSSISELIAQNRLDDAEKRLWSILSQQPDQGWANDVQAYRGLGKLYSSLGNSGNSPQAIDSYSHVVAIAPADVAANVELAVLYQKAGQYKESVAAAQRVPMASRPPRILPVLAADYFATREDAKVPPLIPSLLRHANAEPEVLRDFVTVLLHNGYLDDAAHLMEKVKPVKPSADYLHTLARVRAAQRKPQDAQALLLQALKLQPKSFDLLYESAGPVIAPRQSRWHGG